MYHVFIYTTEGKEFETLVDSKYAVSSAAERIAEMKPEAMVMVGESFAIRAGEIRALVVDGEVEA